MSPKLSIISPVYKAEAIIPKLVFEIELYVSQLTDNYEIILVEDGSPDASWASIKSEALKNPKVVAVKLSRNFGQHYAIWAGLEKAQGEWVVVMDCDLQDRPNEIVNLYNKALEGFDLVLAKRVERQDSPLKKLSSKVYYKIFNYLTDAEQDSGIANFGIYHRKVILSVLQMKDHIKFFPVMCDWVGFNKTILPVGHSARESGASSYTFFKLIKLALDTLISFSDKPLWLALKLGAFISLTSLLYGLFVIYQYFSGEITVLGFSSLIVSIWLFSGIIISLVSIVGIYVGNTYQKVRDRPVYIIDETINAD